MRVWSQKIFSLKRKQLFPPHPWLQSPLLSQPVTCLRQRCPHHPISPWQNREVTHLLFGWEKRLEKGKVRAIDSPTKRQSSVCTYSEIPLHTSTWMWKQKICLRWVTDAAGCLIRVTAVHTQKNRNIPLIFLTQVHHLRKERLFCLHHSLDGTSFFPLFFLFTLQKLRRW